MKCNSFSKIRLPASFWTTEMAGAVESGNRELYIWESVAGTKTTVVTSMVWGWESTRLQLQGVSELRPWTHAGVLIPCLSYNIYLAKGELLTISSFCVLIYKMTPLFEQVTLGIK